MTFSSTGEILKEKVLNLKRFCKYTTLQVFVTISQIAAHRNRFVLKLRGD